MRVGIIGCGRIAPVHLAVLGTIPGLEVVGLCDPDLPTAGKLAERFRVSRVYRTVDELLAEAGPEAVHILTPPKTHAPLAIQVLNSGCHVLVEKPMATSIPDAESMVLAAERGGMTLCVDHNRLFDPVVEQARNLIERGVIGQVVSIETYQGFNRAARPDNHWSLDTATGVFYNLAVHSAYLQHAFIGQVRELAVVSANTGRFDSTFAEELRVLLRGDRALGYFCFSLDIQPHMNELHLYGTRGTLLLDLNTMTLIRRFPTGLPKLIAKSWGNISESLQRVTATAANAVGMVTGRLRLYPGAGRVIRGFYDSLAVGSAPPVTAREGLEVVRLLTDIYERVQARGPNAPFSEVPDGSIPEQPG